MNITSEEARKALAEAGTVTEATRLVAALAGTDLIVMVWGLIWIAGFLWSHLVVTEGWPNWCHGGWFLFIAIGVITTILIGKRRAAPVKNSSGKRIGVFWWAMYVYCYLGMVIFGPYLNPLLGSTPGGAKAMAAINTIIPMFAYVVMGLWLEQNYFIYMGLSFTALTCVAYFLFNPIFFPLMAVAGGGILFGSGLWMRVRWLRALRKLGQYAQS